MWPRAKKSYSQNFLKDRHVLAKIIEASEIQKGERVLEIGSGTGELTQVLVDAGAQVLAVELDHDLIPILTKRFGASIDLVKGDIFDVIPSGISVEIKTSTKTITLEEGKYKIVANIPYAITSPILERFLSISPRPSSLILTIQREVADRIMAEPPDMSLLSVVCQLYGQCRRVLKVSKGAFAPVPKVDSAVMRFDLLKDHQPKYIEPVVALAKQGFSARRKQLHHNLHGFQGITETQVKETLVKMGLDPRVRAENLTPPQWMDLHARLFF
ncbi:TPA: ribosomal RNA small subunit methyltransferase A [Candidatus Uhrbacteria bacterium]|uniref:Ribosomal RNA small subunit methyltransferase A n=2 Tax=Candidatus Uhriibacteriota TaxID=1752732 RepID=A0A0G1Q7R0_9BACT|nr:MAG: Ribosomal RNA small subunit methyltransferase A [Candidatus Uhrbacteria bacterium GW2011_GWF2_46_218]KKU40892.1 MAG: Ribosomal RNA small subunit methyltransferase A [Candidatus Uhrbacteria bacterium GW2011_GWE2_46_68]HBK33955.1 ribosomal RNA small subunit methyltransferase A [Candidatus Uhrbacteria bacterium]HCB19174.1 ribosomal RNA small subunit methyltransferase A [Candidatus Uhrbacteria bacterium]